MARLTKKQRVQAVRDRSNPQKYNEGLKGISGFRWSEVTQEQKDKHQQELEDWKNKQFGNG